MQGFCAGTLMRYFFALTRTELLLAMRIIELARTGGLIFFTCPPERFSSGLMATFTRTIAMPPVTARTHDDRGMATTAIIKAAGYRHRQKVDEGWINPSNV
jgi:hypothetical protein